jgi:hypothetical protein
MILDTALDPFEFDKMSDETVEITRCALGSDIENQLRSVARGKQNRLIGMTLLPQEP